MGVAASMSSSRNAATTNSVVDIAGVTAGRGIKFKGYSAGNTHSAAIFLQVFNAPASQVTLGTTAPTLSFLLTNNFDNVNILPQEDLVFDKGCSIAVTATQTGNGAPGATCDVYVYYLGS